MSAEKLSAAAVCLGVTLGAAAGAPAARAEGSDLAKAREVEQDLVDLIDRVSDAFVVVGGGSGIIASPEGDVLTNHHVVGSRDVGDEYTVILPGNRFETAVLVGTDPRGDIALLRLEGEGPWPHVELGDSDAVEPGDAVLALGNPFGFSKDGTPHASLGVVSAVHRFQGGYSDAIQTDTPINPGNSGGPLLDMSGRLIGINGRIAVRWGNRANTGVGYAIPSNQIRTFIPHFREDGVVRHGVVPGLELENSEEGGAGAVVEAIREDSPAYEEGLREGDVILRAAGHEVHSAQRFMGVMGTLPAGEPLPVIVRRGGEELTFELPLVARQRGVLQTQGAYLGVRLSSREENDGAEVEEVVSDSPAEEAGLQTGDVIQRVTVKGAPTRVHNTAELVRVLAKLEPGAEITLGVLRGEDTVEVPVTLGERPGSE